MATQFGYIRVSSRDQHEDRQVKALLDAGVPKDCLYSDKVSGKDFERPEYQKMLKKLKAGDVLIFRSDMTDQWRALTKMGVDIVVLDMPLLDSRNKRDLVGTLISDLVLELLSFVAETERTFIRQRQREGIEAARARGVRFGRRPMKRPASFALLKEHWKRGDISARGIARALGISLDTARRWLNA